MSQQNDSYFCFLVTTEDNKSNYQNQFTKRK